MLKNTALSVKIVEDIRKKGVSLIGNWMAVV